MDKDEAIKMKLQLVSLKKALETEPRSSVRSTVPALNKKELDKELAALKSKVEMMKVIMKEKEEVNRELNRMKELVERQWKASEMQRKASEGKTIGQN